MILERSTNRGECKLERKNAQDFGFGLLANEQVQSVPLALYMCFVRYLAPMAPKVILHLGKSLIIVS